MRSEYVSNDQMLFPVSVNKIGPSTHFPSPEAVNRLQNESPTEERKKMWSDEKSRSNELYFSPAGILTELYAAFSLIGRSKSFCTYVSVHVN